MLDLYYFMVAFFKFSRFSESVISLADYFIITIMVTMVALIVFLVNPNLPFKSFLHRLGKILLVIGVGIALLVSIGLQMNLAARHPNEQANNTAKQRTTAEKTLTDLYHKKGLKGKIQVQSVKRQSTAAMDNYTVNYTYTEQIEGRSMKEMLKTSLEPDLKTFDEPPLARGISPQDFKPASAAIQVGALADKQPAVKQQYEMEQENLRQQLPSDIKVRKIEYNLGQHVTAKSAKFNELKQEVVTNRHKGLPLGGYYNLNIPQLARDGVIDFVVKLDFTGEAVNENNVVQFENDTLAIVKDLNFSGFWDGTYYFQFKQPDYEWLEARVQNGQLQSVKWVPQGEEGE